MEVIAGVVVTVIDIEMVARMMEKLLTTARLTLLLVHQTTSKSRHTCRIRRISLLNASLFYHEIVVLMKQIRLL